MQRESSLKVWDPQSLCVAEKKKCVKVCMFLGECFSFQMKEQEDV